MNKVNVNDFSRQLECIYDSETYSVRDNGAVLRHPRDGKRPRPTDNKWTFGKPNNQNGYMYISQKRIHRIMATAFHGEPPTKEHVVDHIDTNRQNNRPENLRWLTRLENALLNPITVKRIEFICGSIDEFLKDPSKLRQSSFEPNLGWMRTVTLEEAQACKARMHLWADSDRQASGNGSLGEWVFRPITPSSKENTSYGKTTPFNENAHAKMSEVPDTSLPDLVMAITPGAAQRKWSTPTEFPCCPNCNTKSIEAYAKRLLPGEIFSRNNFSTHTVLETEIINDGQEICVMCESDGLKPWSLAKITLENNLYVHTCVSTFFSPEGAEKQLCLLKGMEWLGEDSIDDYC